MDTKALRANESLKLLKWGFRHSDTYKICKANETHFDIKHSISAPNNHQRILKLFISKIFLLFIGLYTYKLI